MRLSLCEVHVTGEEAATHIPPMPAGDLFVTPFGKSTEPNYFWLSSLYALEFEESMRFRTS